MGRSNMTLEVFVTSPLFRPDQQVRVFSVVAESAIDTSRRGTRRLHNGAQRSENFESVLLADGDAQNCVDHDIALNVCKGIDAISCNKCANQQTDRDSADSTGPRLELTDARAFVRVG